MWILEIILHVTIYLINRPFPISPSNDITQKTFKNDLAPWE